MEFFQFVLATPAGVYHRAALRADALGGLPTMMSEIGSSATASTRAQAKSRMRGRDKPTRRANRQNLSIPLPQKYSA
jgi:hypothetical protein